MQRARVCAAIVLLWPAAVIAQVNSVPAVRSEFRLDAIVARATLLHAGAGLAFRTGYNIRAHFVGAGGVALKNDESSASWRADATLRLLLDPFGENRTGLSLGGGLGVLHDGFEKTRPVGLLALAVEGPPRSGVVWAVELGLGGGARVGVALRRRAGRYR